MEQKFCPACGNSISERAVFCDICGTRVASQPAGYMPQSVYTPVAPVVYVKPKVPGRGFGISSMVLGIIGLIYSLSFSLGVVETMNYAYYGPDMEEFIPLAIVIAVMPLLATIFGFAGKKRGYRCGVSTSGLTMGIIGLCLVVLALALMVLMSL